MIKDLYREETNHDVYADFCCEDPAGSYADEYVRWLEEKLSKLSQHDVSSSFIQQLIDKYEGKIKSAENLKHKGTGQFSDVPTQNDMERLDIRIYERKTFIKDLKALLNGC